VIDDRTFSGFGIELIRRESHLDVRYDAGEIVIEMAESQISEAETIKAITSEQGAYEVILACQKRS
jgi:hypothetical protein